MSATSSMNSVPLWASSKRPTCGNRAGERAFRVPEHSASMRLSGRAAALKATNRCCGARRMMVNRAGHELFARAGLALNQHGAVHRSDQFKRREELVHRAIAADDRVEPETAAQLGAELCVSMRSRCWSMAAPITRASCVS